MAYKMRILYASSSPKIKTLANQIKENYGLSVNAVDEMLKPAYPCDKERIVILGMTLGETPKDEIISYCKELTKDRAANVALLIDGPEAGAKKVKEILTAAGTNVIDKVFYLKPASGLAKVLKFLDKLTDEESKQVIAWIDEALKNLK